jgi:hypothetical protein
MRTNIYLTASLLVLAGAASAQTNLVLTSPGSSTPSYQNILVGIDAGNSSLTGNDNAFVGYGAGHAHTDGKQNTFLGSKAGNMNIGGNNNTFVGMSAGATNTTGGENTFVGTFSGEKNVSGIANTFLGYQSGNANIGGGYNTFLGYQAGQQSQYTNNNTYVGPLAGQYATGASNTFLGYRAGGGVGNTGQFNTLIGVQAGAANTTGNSNIMIGTNAGSINSTGTGNFFLGDNSGGGNSSGGFNVYLGANSGNGVGVNGDNNVAIGFESGKGNIGGVTNTFLGFRADATANNLTNATAIGANAKVAISDALVLGDNVNVGIGTSSPGAKLELVSSTSGTSGLRLTNLTSASSTSLNASKFLTVNASGDVVLANYSSGGRIGIADSFWEQNGRYLQSRTNQAVVIGQEISQMPVGYNLYVSKGILTERIKVAVKNTSEWRDAVFDKSYPLRPLEQVAQYIQTRRHLPDVPSAQEMVERGNDLHQTDALLLAKIEELTLYTLEARRRNKWQQQELAQLRRENQHIKKQLAKRR